MKFQKIATREELDTIRKELTLAGFYCQFQRDSGSSIPEGYRELTVHVDPAENPVGGYVRRTDNIWVFVPHRDENGRGISSKEAWEMAHGISTEDTQG
jgi:hypothetical protein